MENTIMIIRELQIRVMELYCPWWGAFTTNIDDTKNKQAMYDAVYRMDIDQLKEHLL